MPEELQTLHEAQRLLQAAYDEKQSEEKRVACLEKQVFDSWTLQLSNLIDSVITSEKLKDFKLAESQAEVCRPPKTSLITTGTDQYRLQNAIQQHKKARQWDQIRAIRDHIDALETLIEVREYVVDRLMIRVDESVGGGGEEVQCEKIQMRDTEMEGEMRSGSGARAEWGCVRGEGREKFKPWW